MTFQKKPEILVKKLSLRMSPTLWKELEDTKEWAKNEGIDFDLESALVKVIESYVERAKEQRGNKPTGAV